MAIKLYIGNLPYSANDESLGAFFGSAGTVSSASVITDRETGRSRGFGFVEFEKDEEGRAAIEEFDGKEMDGRALKVNEARPREER